MSFNEMLLVFCADRKRASAATLSADIPFHHLLTVDLLLSLHKQFILGISSLRLPCRN